MRPQRLALAVTAAAACATSYPASAAPDPASVLRIEQDVAAGALLERLEQETARRDIVIPHVSIVDPVAARSIPDQTVIVRDGRIAWVGPARNAPRTSGAQVIDGRGRFLSPGLADMHVHSQGMGQHLLRIAAGVTTVRDMDGFPWMLRMRDSIARDEMLGTTAYVVGTIVADRPLDGYAVVISSPAEARAVVRDQAACGYRAIKVHNNLAAPLLDAVAAEARQQQLDLVGHVPHNISLRHAIQTDGMRTLEHLKGFLRDQTLLPSDEDYAPALAGAAVWITPTYYTRIDRAYGADAARLMADPRNRFVPRAIRDAWPTAMVRPGSQEARLYDRFVETQRVVTQRLLPLRPRWLAGTDAAGYRFNIAGFALHDEMLMMRDLGIPVGDVIRAATSEAAAALRADAEFGRVAPGLRADLVLLAADPFSDLATYRQPLGVMTRGRWFDRPLLDRALDALATIYDRLPAETISAADADRLAREVGRLAAQGGVLDSEALLAAAEALAAGGHDRAARRLTEAAAIPADGPCHATRPR